ncbi:cysteine rich repeat-containing protein [Bradyrhizobium tropiciagri]|uniref:cysteine rich repeat-containing protein n=1 Tax=Bradyrhizobium tropiciagri TaxID=312253 RepID=UPI00067C6F05|nr:cysteine rich repeat-containing protein [Bradyrhizobium tropiciagri]
MINALTRATKLSAWLALAAFVSTAPALSQAPTEAQRDAIKSQCRNDYIAHCSSVPPGGEASLQCLQKNMASLGPGCASAVKAVEAPAAAPAAAKTDAAKTEASPAAATAKPAAEAAAPKAAGAPSSAQISAIRSACRSDYPKVCAGVPTGGAPALQCLEKNKAKLSPACGKAVAAAGGGAAPAEGAATAAAPTAAPAVIMLRPLRPREELFVLRSACGADVRSVCGGVQPGGGRIVQCLATNAGSLSPACREVLAPFAAR